MAFWAAAAAARALKAEDVSGFIHHRASRLQCSSLHVLAAAMRSFLSFLHFTGRTRAALAGAVVCPAPRPRNPVPRHALGAGVAPLLEGLRSYASDREAGFCHGLVSLPAGIAGQGSRLAEAGGRGLAGANLAFAANQDSQEQGGATSGRCGGSHPGLFADGASRHRVWRGVCPASSALWRRGPSIGVSASRHARRVPSARA